MVSVIRESTIADNAADVRNTLAGGPAFHSGRKLLERMETGVVFVTVVSLMLVSRKLSLFDDPAWFGWVYWASLGTLMVLWTLSSMGTRAGLSGGGKRRAFVGDACLLGAGLWMAAATLPVSPYTLEHFLVWESGLLLAIYGHRRYGISFGNRLVVVLAASVLVFLIVVSIMQYHQLDLVMSGVVNGRDSETRAVPPMLVGGAGTRLGRAVGVFWTANILGGWLVLLMPFVYSAGLDGMLRRRWISAGFFLATTGAAVLILVRNLSRLSLLVGLLVLLAVTSLHLLRGGRSRRKVILSNIGGLVSALIMVMLLFLVFPKVLRTEGFSRVLGEKVSNLAEVIHFRLLLQKEALKVLMERPIMGVGFIKGTEVMPTVGEIAPSVSPRVEQQYRNASEERYWAHNVYLMMAVEGGIPVPVLFLTTFFYAWTAYLRFWYRWQRGVDAAAVATLAFGAFSLGYNIAYFDLWPLSMFLFGVMRGAMSSQKYGAT